MIFGRPTNQVLAAFTALFNVVVIVAKSAAPDGLGATFTPELVAAVNIAAAAIITLVAGQAPTVNEGSTVKVITPNGDPNKVVTV